MSTHERLKKQRSPYREEPAPYYPKVAGGPWDDDIDKLITEHDALLDALNILRTKMRAAVMALDSDETLHVFSETVEQFAGEIDALLRQDRESR